MNAINQLEAAHYSVVLIERDGMQCVEARRTASATLRPGDAGALLLALSRGQDEAITHMRQREAARLYRQMCGLDGATEIDQAIAVHRWAMLNGATTTSDGRTHAECIRELEQATTQHDTLQIR